MIAAWKQYEGQAVDGIPLLRLLGESDESAVYLAELAGEKCVIKLAPAEESVAQIPLARWQQASKLSHPHVTRVIQWGRTKLGGNGSGRSLVYLAMEYAEETLSNVDRPLTPKEAREMLTPAVAALVYIHSKGMAHGRVKPSNVLSVNDVLKISGDAPLRVGEHRGAAAKPSVYDAPEFAASGVTPAADAWSLGVTLVEALTKKLPVVNADSISLPDASLPDSFREVALGCLTFEPALRWTVSDVQQWLERGFVPAPKRAKRKYVLPAAAAAAVVIAGVIVWPHLTGSPAAAPAAASNTAPAPEPAIKAPAVTPPVNQPETPARPPRGKSTRTRSAAAPAPAPGTPVQTASERDVARNEVSKSDVPKSDVAKSNASDPDVAAKDLPPAAGDSIPAEVVQPVRPDVPSKARATIHGKVPISVRLEADANGSVTEAKVESGGSSKYFADLALNAARSWKFAPSGAGSVWLVRFEFTRSTQVSTQATRIR